MLYFCSVLCEAILRSPCKDLTIVSTLAEGCVRPYCTVQVMVFEESSFSVVVCYVQLQLINVRQKCIHSWRCFPGTACYDCLLATFNTFGSNDFFASACLKDGPAECTFLLCNVHSCMSLHDCITKMSARPVCSIWMIKYLSASLISKGT